MDDLIKRLEAAEGGSRELDRLIGREVFHPKWEQYVGWGEVPIGAADKVRPSIAEDYLPEQPLPYTTSLDAALTLVPEGWRIQELCQSYDGTFWNSRIERIVSVEKISNPKPYAQTNRGAPTPTIALCIAALKARQHG